jgi:hypothetical protein
MFEETFRNDLHSLGLACHDWRSGRRPRPPIASRPDRAGVFVLAALSGSVIGPASSPFARRLVAVRDESAIRVRRDLKGNASVPSTAPKT